jgi:hypothetical protein
VFWRSSGRSSARWCSGWCSRALCEPADRRKITHGSPPRSSRRSRPVRMAADLPAVAAPAFAPHRAVRQVEVIRNGAGPPVALLRRDVRRHRSRLGRDVRFVFSLPWLKFVQDSCSRRSWAYRDRPRALPREDPPAGAGAGEGHPAGRPTCQCCSNSSCRQGVVLLAFDLMLSRRGVVPAPRTRT